MELTLQQKNEVLAEFMGYRSVNQFNTLFDVNGYYYELYDMQFHTSYDWLMPVWRKFRGLEGLPNQTHSNVIRTIITEGSMSQFFEAMVNGILWYNSLKTEKK